ncbi:hypothetical protein QOZ80_6AG0537990 [Eleusine coracana subsp. coracana]|nr:hypothetical protein QOZ80_6AG0537990 [Eleusine coracana subsp. coracana]
MKMEISYCIIVLVILLGAQLSNAALDQATLLRQFLESSWDQQSGVTSAEDDPWSEPETSFGHLPELCKTLPKGSKEADRVVALPGQPPRVNFTQYAGYVTVDEDHGRALFYYFAESPYGAASKPLVLWLNGGPGCSSLGAGAMEELGPFRVNPDGKTLSRNRHAWNNVANVIFLESPAGVGFSYSNTTSDYAKSGDSRTASDAYVFLRNWLERFPEYKGRDFYIAGESYGGHYVPELATVIVALREFTGKNPINLKGIIVGNPLLDHYKNRKGSLEYLWNHGVISDEVWADITQHCSFGPSDGVLCAKARASIQTGNIDHYNIYAPICITSSNGTSYSSSYLPGYDPCIDNYVEVYLNNPEVQKAFHARTNTHWSGCIDLPWNDAPLTMMPMISWLVDTGLRVWIYSGDMDDVCPITATRYSVKDLNLTVTKPWRPWYTPDNEVGGYVQQYDGGFTFASVRGSGHLVPSFQPKRSLVLFYSFLKGMLPPAVSVWRP